MAKASKAEANYRNGLPTKKCGLCSMFRPPHGCTAVRGKIDAGKLCDYFERAKVSDRKVFDDEFAR